jgi:hypothetical protein
MTQRLEAALKQLSPADLEELTALAESMAKRKPRQVGDRKPQWKFDWVGALRDRPEQSGVEAQQIAIHDWIEMMDRKRSR